jgi:pimeloyl-ACP methyl ester carboxylesterase
LVDFVFVHGLGGGSRKTWSKTPADAHFWPKRWLPEDPDFENVRIWSFGYDSIYAKKKSDVLNINDFARALLGALFSSKYFANVETPIVFIGHSMGGLVIKKVRQVFVGFLSYRVMTPVVFREGVNFCTFFAKIP